MDHINTFASMLHSSVFLTEFENKISVFKHFAGAKRQICRETNRSNGSARAHKSPSRPTITGYEAQVMRTCDLIALVTSIFDSYVIPLRYLCDSSVIPFDFSDFSASDSTCPTCLAFDLLPLEKSADASDSSRIMIAAHFRLPRSAKARCGQRLLLQ